MFDLSKLFGSELCQFGIFAHVSDVAPVPLVVFLHVYQEVKK